MPTPDDTDDDAPRCIACDQRPPARHTGWLTCQPCIDRLVTALDDIAHGHHQLDATPGSAGLDPAAARRGFGPRSPARDDVLVLTDRRRVAAAPDMPRNAQSLLRAVGWWADELRGEGLLGDPPPRAFAVDGGGRCSVVSGRSVPWECAVLVEAAEMIASRWWVGDMLDAVEAQARHVRRALGDTDPTIPIGSCPLPPSRHIPGWALFVGDVGEVLAALAWRGPRCGGEIRARSEGQRARCRRCGRRWDTEAELRVLGAQLGDAWADMPALARLLDVASLATLRSWALRDEWRRIRVGRRRLYSVADARDSWWRALDRRQAAAAPTRRARRQGGAVEVAS